MAPPIMLPCQLALITRILAQRSPFPVSLSVPASPPLSLPHTPPPSLAVPLPSLPPLRRSFRPSFSFLPFAPSLPLLSWPFIADVLGCGLKQPLP